MSIVYVDCKYGISGDMTLSSLVDLGADTAYIEENLRKLPIDPFEMSFETVTDHGITGKHLKLKFTEVLATEKNEDEEASQVTLEHDPISEHHPSHDHLHEHHHSHDHLHEHETMTQHSGHHHAHHSAEEILKMITNSSLPERVKTRCLALFQEVARAEGKIHGVPEKEVHFHEVGAMDSIIDFIGVALALESLNASEIIFNSVPTGSGLINIAHGLYPVPAPATAEILVGVPLSDFTAKGELTTPTGAAFAKILATEYQAAPMGEIEKIGYGVGTKKFPHPNVLRTMLLKKKKLLA